MSLDADIRQVLLELKSDGFITYYNVLDSANKEVFRLRVELKKVNERLVESQKLNKIAGLHID